MPYAMVNLRIMGRFGVPLFFVLSAYLITELLMRERAKTGTLHVRSFYIRRMLRIWPLYFACLFLCFTLSRLLHTAPMPVSALLAFLFLIGNFWTATHGFLPLGFGALWTVCIEEQFYLLWPSLVRKATVRVLTVVAIVAYFVAQVGVMLVAWHTQREGNPTAFDLGMNSVTYLQYFILGTLICLLLRGRTPQLGTGVRVVFMLAGLSLLYGVTDLLHIASTVRARELYLGYLIIGIAVVLMLLSVLGVRLSSRCQPLVWLGKVSYGLYLFHLPILSLTEQAGMSLLHLRHPLPFAAVVALPVTIACAAISYRFFETPFLRLKERFTVVHSRGI
jgi:peptidoglycan/LPS O-acetylase OafA/YrhL